MKPDTQLILDTARDAVHRFHSGRDTEAWRYVSREVWSGMSVQSDPFQSNVDVSGSAAAKVMVRPVGEMTLPQWTGQSFDSVIPAAYVVASATEWIEINGGDQVGELALGVSVPEGQSAQIPIWITTSAGTDLTVGLCLSGEGAVNLAIFADVVAGASVTVSVADDTRQPSLVSVVAQQGHDSNMHVRSVDAGATNRVRSIRIVQTGESCVSSVKGLNLGTQSAQTFYHTALNHQVEGGQSTQLVKSILTDRAVSEFNGAVFVAKGAQKTDSSQSNPNMILSDLARAISRPQLHIYADDVKCAHGATMSHIDEAQIHYLQSRGISSAQAKSILMVGFADDVLDDLRHDTVQTFAKRMAQQFFNHVNQS